MFGFFSPKETRIRLFKHYANEIYIMHSQSSGDIEPNAILKGLLSNYLGEDSYFNPARYISDRNHSEFCKTLFSKLDKLSVSFGIE